jgi:hypothetical protein
MSDSLASVDQVRELFSEVSRLTPPADYLRCGMSRGATYDRSRAEVDFSTSLDRTPEYRQVRGLLGAIRYRQLVFRKSSENFHQARVRIWPEPTEQAGGMFLGSVVTVKLAERVVGDGTLVPKMSDIAGVRNMSAIEAATRVPNIPHARASEMSVVLDPHAAEELGRQIVEGTNTGPVAPSDDDIATVLREERLMAGMIEGPLTNHRAGMVLDTLQRINPDSVVPRLNFFPWSG